MEGKPLRCLCYPRLRACPRGASGRGFGYRRAGRACSGPPSKGRPATAARDSPALGGGPCWSARPTRGHGAVRLPFNLQQRRAVGRDFAKGHGGIGGDAGPPGPAEKVADGVSGFRCVGVAAGVRVQMEDRWAGGVFRPVDQRDQHAALPREGHADPVREAADVHQREGLHHVPHRGCCATRRSCSTAGGSA